MVPYADLNGLAVGGSGGSLPHRQHRYLYGRAVDEILASENGGTTLWGLADHQGTIRDVVNSAGTVVDHRVYDSFGNLTSQTGPAVDFIFGYTGQAWDELAGLYDYGRRWYDPAVGRFASEDPTGFDAGDTNLYRYVGNNPMNLIDPMGLCAKKAAGFGAAAIDWGFGTNLVGLGSPSVSLAGGGQLMVTGSTGPTAFQQGVSTFNSVASAITQSVSDYARQTQATQADRWTQDLAVAMRTAEPSAASRATTPGNNVGSWLWDNVGATAAQTWADVANGITNLGGHIDNLGVGIVNTGMAAANEIACMSNFNQPIFSGPIDYVDVPDWSRNLVMPEEDWVHTGLTQASELTVGVALGQARSVMGTTGTRSAAAAPSATAALRQRVLANITESQSARASSSFGAYVTRETQVLSGYSADAWSMTTLKPGSIVYGGVPGQSAFYTDFATVRASGLNAQSLFRSVQSAPDRILGYRPAIQAYRVTTELRVPAGSAINNPALGSGGGGQFFIPSYSKALAPIRQFPLSK